MATDPSTPDSLSPRETAGVRAAASAIDHPASKPAEPDHPMMLDGAMTPGDVSLMARCLIEEMLQVGTAPEQLRAMSRDANYQALFAARHALGHECFDDLLEQTIRRVGRHRHRTTEHTGDVQSVTLKVSC